MKILTVQELANTAKDSWKRQYFYNGFWKHGNDKKTVYENLVALGENPTPSPINEVIGNNCWTRLGCSVCDKEVDTVVVFSSYDSSFYLCKKCLNKSTRLIKGCCMKTDYVFGDRVKVLPKIDEATEYSDKVKDGDIGFVLNNDGSTFPVEVQFVGYSEVFMYEELEFLNSSIEDD